MSESPLIHTEKRAGRHRVTDGLDWQAGAQHAAKISTNRQPIDVEKRAAASLPGEHTSSMKGFTIMTKEEIAEILAKPYAQQLLNGPEPARMAYDGLDGDPRVIPIGFWTEGEQIVMATVPKSAKVAALRKNPKVALTIDQGAFPPKVLLIRGTAEVELVEGIPEGYLTAGHKVMTDDQYPQWVAGVRALYDEMVVITITPTWAKLLDFETTIPKAVEDLIKEKSAH
jgi:Pyridoxamine 5'-phosphate oxidase